LLSHAGAALAAAAVPTSMLRAADKLRFQTDPFTLGVASGYPTPDNVVLWTRLAPSPREPGGGLAQESVIPVEWEIATDERMRTIVRRGTTYATAEWAHSVHVEPMGLEPGREYWYRFTAGGVRSPIGRTRTAPTPSATNARMRIAVASCQQYEQGYFVAYRHMLEDELDLVIHTGDYIYEASWGDVRVRSHDRPQAITLEDYRAQYALYRGDPDLQNAHAAYPWLVTWDDHEVVNDYAGDVSNEDPPTEWFLARRAAAYRAYYEHMPLPRRAVPFGANLNLHTQRTFGQLLSICMLDSRQYRSPLACTQPGRRGSRTTDCPEMHDASRTKLGTSQEGWLQARMQFSRARWNLFAQGTLMSYVDERPGPDKAFVNDSWSGYPAARVRFMDAIASTGVRNPVVLSGDVHACIVANLHRAPHDPGSPVIATELVTTSITSQAAAQSRFDDRRRENPNLLFANSQYRGYLRLDITPERLQADLIAMSSVTDRNAKRSVAASFSVEDGRPGPQPT
jgi:alkaline phosphatase D